MPVSKAGRFGDNKKVIWLFWRKPRKLVLAVPVATAETVALLEREVDRVVCEVVSILEQFG
ncbi:MAG: hypothetical protein H0Z35_10990 [Thermoanaerobacteraceae bacterium]|nr:hypothetical protein [Thermoanaerobacteraceae bacterium]